MPLGVAREGRGPCGPVTRPDRASGFAMSREPDTRERSFEEEAIAAYGAGFEAKGYGAVIEHCDYLGKVLNRTLAESEFRQ